MNAMWLFVICALNFGISWWNAKVVGWLWNDRPVMGLFTKAVLWSAAINSAIGFSSVFMVGLALLASQFMDPKQAHILITWMMSLWYVVVILPILGTGLVITLHSWMEFARTRNWSDLAVSSWNTFAQLHNMYDATQSLGPAFDAVSDMFKAVLSNDDDDDKGAIGRLALALVFLALIGGVLLTAMIIKANIGKAPIPTEDILPGRRKEASTA